ncbi:hypothetical protein CLAFUW4_14263 [Fulvia fulva]|uniref:Fungal calcium binding protein domain-containing protein n=1 Tax=Passalora fulva TaxID=5499 RepID=A0A9Q8PN20_PASFU|nr:uncharacterized protein CLAFUR5_14096 [Fulvia fulva]KAK4609338.1 hypothetical protein CLAFUR4_14264 [Fulvia fulva]KAK4609767.1 hypothetical protein CLAFUR0_14268 [Fulvia fulva]UJO25399.1 hypothetical protein CLAFUR5_14096 [Fulvia fulva]WPV22942.1 hypothetical protein CLAFUW4_14263 [Fulvia fulva]WPV37576.1 hypothetical protein CLAFUW7_14272 [Fulvia fulva]
MQFIPISALALAAVASAAPSIQAREEGQVLISLPPGCTKENLFKCALHLVGTGASCGAAIIEAGANPAADLACVGSAAGTAANFDECKSCIPKKTEVVQIIPAMTEG